MRRLSSSGYPARFATNHVSFGRNRGHNLNLRFASILGFVAFIGFVWFLLFVASVFVSKLGHNEKTVRPQVKATTSKLITRPNVNNQIDKLNNEASAIVRMLDSKQLSRDEKATLANRLTANRRLVKQLLSDASRRRDFPQLSENVY